MYIFIYIYINIHTYIYIWIYMYIYIYIYIYLVVLELPGEVAHIPGRGGPVQGYTMHFKLHLRLYMHLTKVTPCIFQYI